MTQSFAVTRLVGAVCLDSCERTGASTDEIWMDGGESDRRPPVVKEAGTVDLQRRTDTIAAMTPRRAFTIGYQGADANELATELRRQGVSVVVDTRLHPTSRRPAFRRESLRATLEAHGLGYRSEPSLGVPKRIRSLAAKRQWLFRAAYEALLRRMADDFDDVVRLARRETIALLCFEIEPGECHRLLLAEAMTNTAPLSFTHLRLGRGDDADDQPALPTVMRAEQKDQITAG